MTGFEMVAKLKDLEQKATPGKWFYADCKYQWDLYAENHDLEGTCPQDTPIGLKEIFESAHPWKLISANKNGYWPEESDSKLICGLRNAAPLLLDIAGQIRPGDDKLFARLIYEQEETSKFAAGFGQIHPSERVMIDMLKRYQKIAERMEANI